MSRLIKSGAQPRPSDSATFPDGVGTMLGSCFVWEGQASYSIVCHVSLSKRSMITQTWHNNSDSTALLARFDISDDFLADERFHQFLQCVIVCNFCVSTQRVKVGVVVGGIIGIGLVGNDPALLRR